MSTRVFRKRCPMPVWVSLAWLLGAGTPVYADEGLDSWSDEVKQQFALGCRLGILRPAYRDYLLRRGVSAADIPDDPFERFPATERSEILAKLLEQAERDPRMKAAFGVCDCVVTSLSEDVPLSAVVDNPRLAEERMADLAKTGRCVLPEAPTPLQTEAGP